MSAATGSVQHYLERAVRARLEAAKTTDQQTKDELIRLAAAFDLLAEHKKLDRR